MSGKRNPGTVQYEVWITTEASDAINVSAQKHGMTRGEYLQDAIWDSIEDLANWDDRDRLLPPPRQTNKRFQHYAQPRPGYKGRWSMWVRIRCTVANPVPMMLTSSAHAQGYGSGSALVRYNLTRAIHADTGKTVKMPRGRGEDSLFGGKINEVVL